MMLIRRRAACCTKGRVISIDFDEQKRIVTYDGLEACIINNQSYEDESGTSRSREDGCPTDSLDDDAYSSCSSSKDAFGSFSSKWLPTKSDEQGSDNWEFSENPEHLYVKEKSAYAIQFSDVESMKEKFSKLLLGEDITGGCKGLQTALALSNAITNLAVMVFGELWKLEPLSEEKKIKWRREMNWLLSPTNYMIELVPSKQSNANGRMLEIMTPKARADICLNLPALQKLDLMLTEALDLMINTEFWYAEVGSRAEGLNKSTRKSKRWWLPLPQVPNLGLSDTARSKLIGKGKMVYQVFKAAKSINENVLREMPIPTIIKNAITKSGKANLGEELYRVLAAESSSVDEILGYHNLGTEHAALEMVNRLEAAMFVWKEKIAEHSSGKSPVRTSWSFIGDPLSGINRLELLLDRAETLKQLIKGKHPNLPQSFLDATKVQYGKDIGHAILEAYSRVLANLAFSILSRMGEILQEDVLSKPNSPAPPNCFPGISPEGPAISPRVRHSLVYRMNKADEKRWDSDTNKNHSKSSSRNAPTGRSRVWCMSREACRGALPEASP